MTSIGARAEMEREDGRTGAGTGRHRMAVSLAFLANGIFMGSWAPQIPVFAERLGLSPSEMGLMILAFGIGAVASMPLVGRLIGARGSRMPMLVFNIMLVLALPFLVLAPNVPLAVAAILLAGVSTGAMDVAMNANAVAVERRRGSAIMSSCHGFWSVGGVLGAAVGGFAIAHLGPEAHGLLTGALILAAFCLIAPFAFSDAPSAETAAEAPHGTETRRRESVAGPLSGYRGAVLVGFFALFAMIPEGAAIDWSAFYLRRELGADAAVSGLAFAAFSGTMAVFRFAGDGVRNRLGAVRTMRWCSAAAILGLVLAGLAPNALVALAGFAVMGVGISNMVPIAFSAAGNLKGLKPGAGLSVVTALGYSGILIAPSVIGFTGEHVGFARVFVCLSALIFVTFLASPLMKVADGEG